MTKAIMRVRLRIRTSSLLLVLLLASAGCGRINFDGLGGPDASDGNSLGADALVACTGPYLPARPLTEVNSADIEMNGAISADGLELYFASDRLQSGSRDLYVATRSAFGTPFGAPVQLASLSAGQDADPFLEADGLTLWWVRAGSIVRAVRATRQAAWSAPIPVAELDGAGSLDHGPTVTADGLTIYFGSDRITGPIDSNLYRATRSTRAELFGTPVLEAAASTASQEFRPELLLGDQQVAFASTRGGGFSQMWIAPRSSVDGSLGTPTLLGIVDSTERNSQEYDVFATPDDTLIGVSSSRSGGLGQVDLWLYERACP